MTDLRGRATVQPVEARPGRSVASSSAAFRLRWSRPRKLGELAADFLPGHYEAFEEKLTVLARRAKRAAVKLLYEALEKLLRIFRSAIPQDSPFPIASATAEIVDWLAAFALTAKIRNGLAQALRVDELQAHVQATLGALPAVEAEGRAPSVWASRERVR